MVVGIVYVKPPAQKNKCQKAKKKSWTTWQFIKTIFLFHFVCTSLPFNNSPLRVLPLSLHQKVNNCCQVPMGQWKKFCGLTTSHNECQDYLEKYYSPVFLGFSMKAVIYCFYSMLVQLKKWIFLKRFVFEICLYIFRPNNCMCLLTLD